MRDDGTGRDAVERLERIRADAEMDREIGKTYQCRARRLEINAAVARETYGLDSPEAEQARIAGEALAAEHKAEQQVTFAAEWTAEVTAQRRAEWNALVSTGAVGTWLRLRAQERRQGWTLDGLKLAVQMHAK